MTDNSILMKFSDKLNNLITKTGTTNYSLAKHLNISQKTVRNWRQGIDEPRGKNLNKLAEYFGVLPSYFYGEQECAPTLRGKAHQISEKIEVYLARHPEEAGRIEGIIDALTREQSDFQSPPLSGSQAERKEEGRTKKGRRKTA
ncbi:MAG: helix-turn-helix domain-containing protein [Nitrospirae bacterium]|nr:helix-turn-helix domain-containing protein [Nitrospirota bacterium]